MQEDNGVSELREMPKLPRFVRIPVKLITDSGVKPITDSGQTGHLSERSDAGLGL